MTIHQSRSVRVLATVLAAAMLMFPTAESPALGAGFSVDPSGRHLLDGDGKPFFWLGDTAWLLSQMTDRKDVETYLQTRARQGFTVIQAALVMGGERLAGTLRPNRFGDTAFMDGDVTRPNVTPGSRPGDAGEYDYWDHVDHILDVADKNRLIMAVLPLFVGYAGEGYKYLNANTAAAYGKFLGERYRSRNLIWVLGGDHAPKTEQQRAAWNVMARSITQAVAGREDYGKTMMTFHINGGHSSSEIWHEAPWLDFHMAQTWDKHTEIGPMLQKDWTLPAPKPCGLGEGAYEDGPQYATGPVDALMTRKQAYWSYFAGGYHTYGNTNVWNFGTFEPEATQDWKAALDSPGARSLAVLRKIFERIPWWKLEPAKDVLARRGEVGSMNRTHVALRASDGSAALIYASGRDKFAANTARLAGGRAVKATWIDPRSGMRRAVGGLSGAAEETFATPPGWQDALLYIEGSNPDP